MHPDDERYEHLIGTKARLPIIGRELIIVGDEAIEKEFGTGALKVTPGHDPVDFEIGQRHDLPIVNGDQPRRHDERRGRPLRGHGPLRLPRGDRARPRRSRAFW